MRKGWHKGLSIALVFILVSVIIVCDYIGYIPAKYDYSVGSVATTDVYATRTVIDNYQTKYEALRAMNSVPSISVRSEAISDENRANVKSFFQLIRQARSSMTDDHGTVVPDTSSIKSTMINNVSDLLGYEMDDATAEAYLTMSYYAFNFIEDKANAISEILMMEIFDDSNKESLINNQIAFAFENEETFNSYSGLLSSALNALLKTNTIVDSEATKEAALNEYNRVLNTPVEVEKGTKIITTGQVISDHEYQLLADLDMIRDSMFSLLILARIASYVVIVSLVLVIYLIYNKDKLFDKPRLLLSLILAFIVPFIIGIYATGFSAKAIIILFFTVLCATYFGITNGIVLSVFLLMYILPIYSFDMEVIFTQFVGIVVCSCLAGRKNTKNTSASIIVFSTLSILASSVVYNFFIASPQHTYLNSLLWLSISTLVSVVFSVGFMPIFEILSNAVSPIRLIDLSQPSQPLLKRLFLEAPGTSQHCTMVANLADAAADAIGADALLCRVASYYHDIGKLEKPLYFTENQEGFNPHSLISPRESVEIITAHTVNGVALAKKSRLPQPVIDIISEHHGNAYPAYFFKKAQEEAELKGLPAPEVKDFCYSGKIPQTRESAVIMLADICEATLKSKKDFIKNASDAEIEIRRLIKDKIDHDQLNDSQLSFDDLEKIITAFTMVYAGQFHERISYTNDNKPK